jgi:glucose/arabinose dehydrogenase
MFRALLTVSVLALGACSAAVPADGDGAQPAPPAAVSETKVKLTPFVEDSEQPWGMVFLSNGELLFTEKEGGLKRAAAGGAVSKVDGLPAAYTEGQAGYLGLALDPDFAGNRLVYVAYSKGKKGANATAVIRARLSDDGARLENVTQIFEADTRPSKAHFGGRLQFRGDGTLFVSLGDAFVLMDEAQNPMNTHGKIVRINPDGTIPADNPYADGVKGKAAVWSYGHRNIQGLFYDAETDTLWETEHGPKGGDELNRIEPGKNYGWPKVTYGVNYDGTVISAKTEGPDYVAPATYWVPSIAPSGLVKLTSDVYPGWKGDLFVGGMNGPDGLELTRVDMDETGKVVGRESLFNGEISVRDVIQGPDGHLYVASKDFDGIFRVDLAQ